MVISLTISSTVATLADENRVVPETPIVETVQPTAKPIAEPTQTSAAIDLINAQPTATPKPSPSSAPTSSPSSIPSPQASAEQSPTAQPSPESSTGKESPTASPSPTPKPKPKPHPLNPQPHMNMIIPNSLSVDPRATRIFVPRTYFSGAGYALMCLRSNKAMIDIAIRNQIDDFYGPDIKVIGDLTNEVYITGPMSFVEQYINLQDGIQLISRYGGLGGSYVRIDLVAMSEPDIDPSFCDAGAKRWMGIRSLGLMINTIQTTVTLRRKTP